MDITTFLADIPLLPRVAISTALSYIYLVVLIRLTGKRSVAQMNSFDWIVNVAVGSLAASAILDPSKLVEAWLGIAVVIVLQLLLTQAAFYSPLVSRLIKEEPRLLVKDGRMLTRAMNRARVNEDEVMAGVRQAGQPSLKSVGAMIFEADGNLSVIARDDASYAGSTPDALERLGLERDAGEADA